jgi:RNA polymerase sigma-70 factor (ECF subfamily)
VGKAERNIATRTVEIAVIARDFDVFFRSHADWLRQQLARRLRVQAADVDDLVQESFLRATRQPANEIVHPRALLSKIAFNLFRDRKRRDAVRAGHCETVRQEAAQDNSASRGLAEQEVRLELERLIGAMPEIYRDVFVLSRFRHMTNKDIADHLGLSIKTVEWRMGKALEYCVRRLRD